MLEVSEVARVRQLIRDEYVASQQGLSGLASGVSRHRFITQRTENIAHYFGDLRELVGEQEALSIVIEEMDKA